MNFVKGIHSTVVLLLCTAFYSDAAVEKLKLKLDEVGFIGSYYELSNTSSKKPVIVLGGSEGGIPEKLAEGIASLGYPTLAVAYFREGKLPEELEKIPLDYFENAKTWLKEKDGILNDNIVLVGWSKGAELALLLASKDSTYNHVVAIAPSSVVWAGILKDWTKVPRSSWVMDNVELPFVSFNPTSSVTGLLDLYSQSLEARTDNAGADIPVKDINGKVFLYSGGKDEIWPSSSMAATICEKMQQNELSDCHHFDYGELDHLLGYKFLDTSDPLHKSFAESLEGG